MLTETTGQQAKKSFMITVDGNPTAEELQAELNEWLQAQYAPAAPPPTAQVKQVLDAGYISQDELQEAHKLLEAYGATAEPYQHPLNLLYNLATDYGDNRQEEPGNGFWDWESFIKSLVEFFLRPENVSAFVEQGGGSSTLPRHLPELLTFFSELASSSHVDALLENVYYQQHGLSVKKQHHNRVMKIYGSKLAASRIESEAA